ARSTASSCRRTTPSTRRSAPTTSRACGSSSTVAASPDPSAGRVCVASCWASRGRRRATPRRRDDGPPTRQRRLDGVISRGDVAAAAESRSGTARRSIVVAHARTGHVRGERCPMHRLVGARQHYAWGSRSAIPQLVGEPPSDEPLAELWFGAHPAGPTRLASGESLQEHLAAAPEERLGSDVLAVFGPRLPYRVNVIAPASPLSLPVHPSREQAREGFAREEARGVAPDAPHRSYPDDNHKPEMLYALEPFEALAGFRAARRAVELLRDLDTVLARELVADLRSDLGGAGVRAAFTRLLDPATRPGADAIAETVAACAARLAAGRSPSVRSDRIVAQLAEAFPGDVGAVASLLMNP